MVAFFPGLLLASFTCVVFKVTVIVMCGMVVLGLRNLSQTGHIRQEVVEMKRFEHQTQTAPIYSCFLAGSYNFHNSNTVNFTFPF